MFYKLELWMVKDGLRLKGLELLLFIVIWSFTLNNRPMYMDEASLADLFGYTRERVGHSLRSLTEKKLIIRLGKHPGRQSYAYTANKEMVGQYITAGSEKKSRPDAKNSPSQMVGNVIASCEQKSHNNKNDRRKIDNNRDIQTPPSFDFGEDELNNRWLILLESKKWTGRSPEALQIIADKLRQYPVETAIEMVTHTIEGDYPEIYPPTQAIIDKANRRSKKTTAAQKKSSNCAENQIFGTLIKLIPQDLRPVAFGPGGQSRNALYITIDDTTVTINSPEDLKEWMDNNKQEIDEAVHAILPQATIEYNIYRTTTPGTSSERVV